MEMLQINSADRHSGTPSDFKVSLHSPIIGKYKLEAALIPHTAPPVTASRNGSIVVDYDNEGGTTQTIALGDYYDQTSLLAALKTALDTSGYTHTLTVDPSTQRLTIKLVTSSNNVGDSIVYFSESSDAGSTLASVLGMYENITIVGATGNGNSKTLSSPINLAVPLCYTIRIDGHTSMQDSKGRPASFVIPITCDSHDLINYSSGTSFCHYVIFPKHTRSVHVQLFDDQGAPITSACDHSFIIRKIS